MDALWLTLQESGFGLLVRNSVVLYPVANLLHVVGVMAFFGLVATMDLALLGVSGSPAKPVIARLRPFAVALLLLIAATGSVLFVAEAVAIAANTAFQFKIALLGFALVNVIVNKWALRTRGDAAGVARLTALLSLLAWLGVAALGRLIAYV